MASIKPSIRKPGILDKYSPGRNIAEFIKEQEGNLPSQAKLGHYRNNRFYMYGDAAGNRTIGYGHKLTVEEIKSGRYRDGISEADANAILRADLTKATVVAQHHFGEKGWAEMKKHQKDATIDMAFNLGPGGLKKFPRWSKAVRDDDWKTVQKESVRHYRSPTKGWQPMDKRNAAYNAAFVEPHLPVEIASVDTP
jgi:GH24 family phage-related lysozyme (muramidase)